MLIPYLWIMFYFCPPDWLPPRGHSHPALALLPHFQEQAQWPLPPPHPQPLCLPVVLLFSPGHLALFDPGLKEAYPCRFHGGKSVKTHKKKERSVRIIPVI